MLPEAKLFLSQSERDLGGLVQVLGNNTNQQIFIKTIIISN